MDMQKVGNFIQKVRKELNMSQDALGEYLFVTGKAVSKWERGLACPDIENLKKMSLLFNCEISEIINGAYREMTHSSNLPADSTEIFNNDKDYNCDVNIEFDFNTTDCISPLLFGDNLEHTRDCVNGGISAQMLKNRKFVGKPGRYGCSMSWYKIGEKTSLSFGTAYTKHFDGYKMKRVHECNSQVITNYFPEKGGIGQKEMVIKSGMEYEFAIVGKAFSNTVLLVRLTGAGGKVYDEKEILFDSSEYTRKQLVLCPNADDDNASIELTFSTVGTVEIGAVSLMPGDHFHGMRRDVIEQMKQIGMKLLRWPGGNFAGEYNWKDGLLQRDERAPFQSYMWIETQPHTMGYDFHEINTDDFLALCKEIGAEPFITINPTWNTPEESAQWVEYCNGDVNTPYGKLRAERGHEEPYNVQFWSLGNEFGYGHMEGANDPSDYSKIVRTHAKKMLEVTSEITLCSSGPYPDAEWVNHSAKVLSKIAPIVSLHHYANYPEYIDPATREEEYYDFINKVNNEFFKKIHDFREMLNDDNIKISFDEWNAWYAWYRGGSVSEGILAASFLNMLFQNADQYGISMACHFESVNEGAMKVYPDAVSLTPTGQVLSLMKNHANGMICALKDDVTATRKGNILTCTLLNRSYDKEKKFVMPEVGELILSEVYSSDDVVPNTIFDKSVQSVEKRNGSWEIIVPKHSIVLLKIKLSELGITEPR